MIDYTNNHKCVIHNDVEHLRKVYIKATKHGYIWVGFNSRNYDSILLKAILCGRNAWEINDVLINQHKKEYQILTKEEIEQYPLINFDISDKFHSLKQFEGFMGQKIKESDVDFNIDHKLTKKEIDETIYYCTHDVEQTIEVFNNKREEFDSQAALIQAFNLPLEDFNRTKAQLVAKILKAKKQQHDDEFDIIYPDTLILNKYKYVLEWFKDPSNHRVDKSLYTEIAGIPHVIGWGGIHGSKDNYHYKGTMLCADVASLYPSIMIEYGLLSRNVSQPDLYKEIRDTRLKLKKEKNPMQLPYKIVLNSTYGASGDQYNPLHDPRMCRCVCVTGQLLLLDLIEKIEPYCELIQSNTDGVYLGVEDEKNIPILEDIMEEWQTRTRLTLEIDKAKEIWQKDVNNYVLVEEDCVKTKGAYVKKLSKIDYDLPIINKALVNYFIKNEPISQTIEECNDLIEFQKIIKLGGSYTAAYYGEEKLKERVLRVFASKLDEAKGVFKTKPNGNPEKIANTPEKCFIYNDDVTSAKIPEYLDKNYYIEMAENRLNDFLNGKGVSKVKNEIKGVSNEIKNTIEKINSEKKYPNFTSLLNDLSNINCNSSALITLIKLDYLSAYGNINQLLEYYDIYKKFYNKKTIKKDKCEEMGLSFETVRECCKKETDKMFSQLNWLKLINLIFRNKNIKLATTFDKIHYQIQLLGYTNLIAPCDDDIYAVQAIETNQWGTPFVTLYQVNSGATSQYKADKRYYSDHPIEMGDIIDAAIREKDKKRKSDNGWETIGSEEVLVAWSKEI